MAFLGRLFLTFGVLTSTAFANEVVRIMAANTTSGNGQDYDLGEGIRIFQGLDPDIVLIQEFNYLSNTTANFRSFVDTAFGSEFEYFREPAGDQIPNGIISRYPIIASGEWVDSNVSNRDFAWARIDIPGDKDLWAVSVHFLTSSSSDRNAQATALRNYIQANVPTTDYLVVGGDFNTDGFSESALTTLSSVVNTSGRPDDQNGDTGTNASREKPYDQVLPDPDLDPLEIPVAISGHSFTYSEGLVFDSRIFTPLSAVSPVLSSDSGAANMQHMAVIRDFLIPSSTTPVEPSSHVTNFAGTPTSSSISLSWTDSNTNPSASGYLIKASTSPTITAPTDGVSQTPDTNLSDGSATLLVAQGLQTASFAGLPANTNFHFKIYPYATGSPINYKIDGTVPSLTVTTLPSAPTAPVIGSVLYPHSTGFTISWIEVVGATGYYIDVSESPNFTGASGILLNENFDASSTNVPANWTDFGTANSSSSAHYSSPSNCRSLGENDSLITPSVNFPSEISFNVDSSNGGNGSTATISYSINNGAWQSLSSFTVSQTGSTNIIPLTSSPKLDNLANVRFRFESTFSTWYLDDVSISSTASPGFVAGYENLSVGNTCHYAISDLDPSTAYYYRVRAVNAAGTGPNSTTGTTITRITGLAFSVWASDQGITPANSISDFDNDSLTDFQEYLFATDPKQATSPSTPLQLSTDGGAFQITYRRSFAPDIQWSYQGNTDLSAIHTVLSQGLGLTEYQIISIDRFGTYEEVTLEVNTGGNPMFFFRVKAVEAP